MSCYLRGEPLKLGVDMQISSESLWIAKGAGEASVLSSTLSNGTLLSRINLLATTRNVRQLFHDCARMRLSYTCCFPWKYEAGEPSGGASTVAYAGRYAPQARRSRSISAAVRLTLVSSLVCRLLAASRRSSNRKTIDPSGPGREFLRRLPKSLMSNMWLSWSSSGETGTSCCMQAYN